MGAARSLTIDERLRSRFEAPGMFDWPAIPRPIALASAGTGESHADLSRSGHRLDFSPQ
jgi:hypothetical protein